MLRQRFLILTGLFVLLMSNTSTVRASDDCYALLVGCTKYPNNPKCRELSGPVNDVRLWTELLTDPDGFAFPKKNITQLAGWPDEKSKRPTYANIVKGFQTLIAQAKEDSRVVIVLCGHGVRIPIPKSQNPLDPANPEPDGMDEVFLPADTEKWDPKIGLKNSIKDDQIGSWLNQLRAKGAHVFIVFDCCHSGTMTRNVGINETIREVNRSVDTKVLGITDREKEESRARATKAVKQARKAGKVIPEKTIIPLRSVEKKTGSLVAFYAAQPFEEAPELILPIGAPRLRKNFYGAFTWVMIQTMKSRSGSLSYTELEHLVSLRYRSLRGTRPPTPFAEGDLNRGVLGLKVWPIEPKIYVKKSFAKIEVDAGQLQGVTKDSILEVHPPLGEKPPEKVLGHLKVTTAGVSKSTVVPVKKAMNKGKLVWQKAPNEARRIPESARCEILIRNFADMRVKLFTTSAEVKKTLDTLYPKTKALFRLMPREDEADWVLRVVTPKEAKTVYGIDGLKEKRVFLVHGEGRALLPGETVQAASSENRMRKVFGQYAMKDNLARDLDIDLPKIFKWENLWRVSSGVNTTGGGSHGLVVEMLNLKDENDVKGEPMKGHLIKDGQDMVWRITNKGANDLWVTAIYLEANLGIEVLYSGGVDNDGEPINIAGTVTTDGDSYGQEGLVVFAVPQLAVGKRPDFSMLEQEPLKVAPLKNRGEWGLPKSPFGKLLGYASFHSEVGSRGFRMRVSSTPAITTRSWIVVK